MAVHKICYKCIKLCISVSPSILNCFSSFTVNNAAIFFELGCKIMKKLT